MNWGEVVGPGGGYSRNSPAADPRYRQWQPPDVWSAESEPLPILHCTGATTSTQERTHFRSGKQFVFIVFNDSIPCSARVGSSAVPLHCRSCLPNKGFITDQGTSARLRPSAAVQHQDGWGAAPRWEGGSAVSLSLLPTLSLGRPAGAGKPYIDSNSTDKVLNSVGKLGSEIPYYHNIELSCFVSTVKLEILQRSGLKQSPQQWNGRLVDWCGRLVGRRLFGWLCWCLRRPETGR